MAAADPLWTVLTEGPRHGKWNVAEFFRTGEEEIRAAMSRAASVGYPARRDAALDFGCGVGRLTQALSGYFATCYGVDISEEMVRLAQKFQGDRRNVEFLVNARSDLSIFEDESVDLVYTGRVLQHLPDSRVIAIYLSEFVRILRAGGLIICQIPTRLTLRYKLQPRRRLYSVLRAAGLPGQFLYRTFGLCPMRMVAMPKAQVVETFARSGGRVLAAEKDSYAAPLPSLTYYVVKGDANKG